ncbi:MAG: transglutaminase family protein, partial [Acidobacteria bacterium]|nr:transglutaminase family protein [Acidobacteriota bacterium]
YDPKVTSISTPVSEVLHHKHGVCQDFAHLMIACLRSLGGPARYVSGYLVPLPGVVGAQASHAWVSAFCPTMGWVDFDPTNDVIPSNGHITLAWGRDFADVSPLRGVIFGGGDHTVDVEVKIRPA